MHRLIVLFAALGCTIHTIGELESEGAGSGSGGGSTGGSAAESTGAASLSASSTAPGTTDDNASSSGEPNVDCPSDCEPTPENQGVLFYLDEQINTPSQVIDLPCGITFVEFGEETSAVEIGCVVGDVGVAWRIVANLSPISMFNVYKGREIRFSYYYEPGTAEQFYVALHAAEGPLIFAGGVGPTPAPLGVDDPDAFYRPFIIASGDSACEVETCASCYRNERRMLELRHESGNTGRVLDGTDALINFEVPGSQYLVRVQTAEAHHDLECEDGSQAWYTWFVEDVSEG